MTTAKEKMARIVPALREDGGPASTRGTKVYVDGEALPYVTEIVIRGKVGDLWRAEIHCFAPPPETEYAATIVEHSLAAPQPFAWYCEDHPVDHVFTEPVYAVTFNSDDVTDAHQPLYATPSRIVTVPSAGEHILRLAVTAVLERCSGRLFDTDQLTGETFDELLRAALRQID